MSEADQQRLGKLCHLMGYTAVPERERTLSGSSSFDGTGVQRLCEACVSLSAAGSLSAAFFQLAAILQP